MILISDSGSTKTDWVLLDDDAVLLRAKTQGLNPTQQKCEDIAEILERELKPQLEGREPDRIFFYGAGCAYEEANLRMRTALESLFVTRDIEINSDLLAAARALCGHEEGIACILGTGSNSCYYNGKKIVDNIPPLGFILGDEGSGATLGRQLVNGCLKRQFSQEICTKFFEQYNLDVAKILERVYREPMPGRFLASLSPFLCENRRNPEIRNMLVKSFVAFFQHNSMAYRRSWLPVHFVGGIAVNFQEEVKEAAESLGLSIGNIVESPMKGLIEFHTA
ncbi:MAG: ATPase [Bacteroidaceae bacterium]|nr:ATPase [Bacteroidaceae bacterium]